MSSLARRGMGLVTLLAITGLGVGAAERDNVSVVQAVQNRDQATLKKLLKQGAAVSAPTTDGTTALHWAVYWNDPDTVELLLQAGAKIDAANRYGATPLWMACSNDDGRVANLLLKAGADPNLLAIGGEPPLMAAARAGNNDVVAALLARGADVNAKDKWRGQTALMWAVGNPEPHPDIVRTLLKYSADVHVRSTTGLNALMFAVRQNDLESAKLLLDAGAKVNEKGPGGTNALLMAITNNHYDLGRVLLDFGADPNLTDNNGFTALHQAVRRRAGANAALLFNEQEEIDKHSTPLLKELLAHGADPNARLPLKRYVRPVNENPDGYPAIIDVEYGGATPLWMAANAVDLEAIRTLVAAGADPSVPSIEHTTPLMVAAGLGHKSRGPSMTLGGWNRDNEPEIVETLKLLLQLGNELDGVNDNGQTALHGAAGVARPTVVQFLVDRGARLDLTDALGRTPAVVAEDNTTDKYRIQASLDANRIQQTNALLQRLGQQKKPSAQGRSEHPVN